MKKFWLIILLTVSSALYSFAQGVLIITQYYKGTSNNKWLEVTNVGNNTIDLTSPQLYLVLFSNENADDPANSTHNGSFTFSGSLAAAEILLFQNSSAVIPTYAAGISTGVCTFNGDDLVIISTSNSTTSGVAWSNRLDIIGDGSSWGNNTSFSRKTSSINPSTTFNIADWNEFTNSQVDGASTGTNERLDEFSGYTPLPVELSSFSASIFNNGVRLNWRTETEVNNHGFEVERTSPFLTPYQGGGVRQLPDGGGWETIGFVEGHGNSNSPKNYFFIDDKITSGKYAYRLKQIDNDGTFEYSKIIEIEVDAPLEFELSQNYPNPFNPSTIIKFSLPVTSNVKLSVFNILGEEVQILVNETKEAGIYTINFSGVGGSTLGGNAYTLPSGIYFYKLETRNFLRVKKMSLIR